LRDLLAEGIDSSQVKRDADRAKADAAAHRIGAVARQWWKQTM
jgi:hypothetical protein